MNVKEIKPDLRKKDYILDCTILLLIIQLARVIIKYILQIPLNMTLENINIVSIISMMIVGISVSFILKGNDLYNPAVQRLIKLNNRYNNKNIRLIFGGISLICICIAPYLKGGYQISNLIILFLTLIVEPIFEEIIFREYLWNYIESFEKNENKTLIIITILSSIFKIGYWDIISQNLNVIGSSFFTIDIMLSKIFWGLIVAFILGIIKIKYKDINLCIFSHSFINIFL